MPRRKKEDELPPDQKGPPRGAANARERTRMRVLSKAFGRLKLTLPWVPPDTKLSKLDTLRLATSYISHLQVLLESEDEDNDGSDNDNEKDIKIDSSVRARQLTSLVSKSSKLSANRGLKFLYRVDLFKPIYHIFSNLLLINSFPNHDEWKLENTSTIIIAAEDIICICFLRVPSYHFRIKISIKRKLDIIAC